MRVLRLSAFVLAITGFVATSAAPTSEMRSDHAGRPMPTEIQRARDKIHLVAERSRPSESACTMVTSLVQNNGPDEVSPTTGTRSVETSSANPTGIGAELPVVSGSKWILVPDMQVDSTGSTITGIDMRSRTQAHNGSGSVVNITMWTLGRENSLSAGVMVMVTMALLLAAVLGCSCMSLWCLRRMRASFQDAIEQVNKGQARVGLPPCTVPTTPKQMWPMSTPSTSPLSMASDTVYSLDHYGGTSPAWPSWRTAYPA